MPAIKIKLHDYAFLGRDFVEFADAKISVMTHAFMYGTAVFEGIRAYYDKQNDKLYALLVDEHLQRLLNSCKILRLKPYYDIDEMKSIVVELLRRNKPKTDVYVRPSWFKSCLRIGPSVIGDSDDEDSFVVTSIDLGDYLDTQKGISVQVSSWRRLSDNAIPARSKINGSYVNTALAKSSAILAGFDDSIFLNEDGHVAEGSAMNLFIVRNGELITSGVHANILEGITRQFIIDIASDELNLSTTIREIDRSELYLADEAFFCGTGAQIVPIGQIDHYQIANGKVGSITAKLQNLYNDICHGKISKYQKVLTEI
jgi:branched-chain amino acid aminotransferase